MKRILFVDDNEKYRQEIATILKDAGYEVDDVEDAIAAIEILQSNAYDLIISDLQMEAMDGIRLMNYVKRGNPETKTIILTGAATPESEIEALSLNVDKYLRKDLRKDVLLKYIESIFHEITIIHNAEKTLKSPVNNIVVNLPRHEVYKNDTKMELTNKEFELLVYMLQNKGYAISREEFIEKFWDQEHEVVDVRVVDAHLKALRKKLQIINIVAIRGFGYKWSE